jgi:hypothetical protein
MHSPRLFRALASSSVVLAVASGGAAPAAAKTVALAPHMTPPPPVEIRDRFHDSVVRGLAKGGADVMPAAEVRMQLGIDPSLLTCEGGGKCIGRVTTLLSADRVVTTDIEDIGKTYTVRVRVFDESGQSLGAVAEERCDICTVREAGVAVERAAEKVVPQLAPKPAPRAAPTEAAAPEERAPTLPGERAATPPGAPAEEDEPGARRGREPARARETLPAPPPVERAPEPVVSAPPAAPTPTPPPPESRDTGFAWRAAGGVFLAIGLASIIPMGVFSYYANREGGDNSRYTCDATDPRHNCPDMYKGNTAPAVVFGVLSAAAITTGAILVHVGRSRDHRTTLAASPLPGGAAASLRLEF